MDFTASQSFYITSTKSEGARWHEDTLSPRAVSDFVVVIWASVVCFGRSGKEGGWAVIGSPPGGNACMGGSWKDLGGCIVLWGSVGNFLWGKTSISTSRTVLTRSREAGDFWVHPPLPLLTWLFGAVTIESPVPVAGILEPSGRHRK